MSKILKAFKTLKGFINGYEPDEETYFSHSAALRIFGDNIDFDEISQNLKLSPTSFYKKGDKARLRGPIRTNDDQTKIVDYNSL